MRDLPHDAATLPGEPDDGPPRSPPRDDAPGPTRGNLLGRYVVLDRLGAGGMGVVYAAWDPELDRKVAIKLLHTRVSPELAGESPLIHEARAMARLAHPNVLAVHDVGTLDGQVFVATEFVDGVTLRHWLATPRPWPAILATLLAAGAGLAAAHAAGIVHRDFKPENVMVARDGRVRVMDFGLARPADTADRRTAAIAGTPAYMAPEQWEGRPQGAQTDLYAFCLVAWEALYGEHPVAADSLAATADAIVHGRLRPPPPGARVPGRLQRTLARGLRVDPRERHPGMPALLAELQRDPGARLLRGAQLAVTVAATAALAYAGWLATRPGAVSVRVLGPHGPSAVHVGPHALAITGHDARGPVPAGTYRLTVEAPDHRPREAVVDVERGREVHLDLALEHEQGHLDLDVDPRDATVFVDDVDHGSRLKALPVDTGVHHLRVRHPGHYDRELEWSVAAGQTRAGYVSLPRALVWSRRETGTQHDDRSLGDLDGDGRDELLHRNFGHLVIYDPWRDREVWRAPNDPMSEISPWIGDLDGDGRRDLAVAEHLGDETWRLAVWTADALARPRSAPLWTHTGRKLPRLRAYQQRGLLLDIDGDRADDLVTALFAPDTLTAHAGPSGRSLWTVPLGQTPDALWVDREARRIFAVAEGRELAVDARTGAILWAHDVDPAPLFLSRLGPLRQDDRPDLLVARQRPGPRLEVAARDGADGRLLWTRSFDHDSARTPTYMDLVPGAFYLSIGHDTHVHDGATGEPRWTAPMAYRTALFRHEKDDPWVLTASSQRGLAARYLDGAPAFERDLGVTASSHPLAFDWDGDGDHALAVAAGDTIHLIDRDGTREASLWLPDTSLETFTVIGDVDHDGGEDLTIRALGGPSLVRGARVLWSRRGQDAVRTTPVIADLDADGRSEVIVGGIFDNYRGLHVFDAATGETHPASPTRAPADVIRAPLLLPRADGGRDILIHILDPATSLRRYDGRTGDVVPTPGLELANGYATPALADLDGDGRDELLVTPWNPGPFAVFDADLTHQWSFTLPAGSWFSPTVARDRGGTRLVFHLHGGTLLAVDPATRAAVWSQQFSDTPFVAPTAVDLDGDGDLELVLSRPRDAPRGETPPDPAAPRPFTDPGELVCLRLADGAELWRRPGLAGRSSPVVARDLDGDGHPELLHTSNGSGVLLLDRHGDTLWQFKPRPNQPRQPSSDGGGLLTDLDGDGHLELVTALRDGVVYILDARTGALRWQFHTDADRVEAAPAAADIDGDGRQELFIGGHDHALHALRTPVLPRP